MKPMSGSTREWLTNNIVVRFFTSPGMKAAALIVGLCSIFLIPATGSYFFGGGKECRADNGRMARAKVEYVGEDSQGGRVTKNVWEDVCTYPAGK